MFHKAAVFALGLLITALIIGYALAAIVQFIEEIYYDFFNDN